MSDDGVRDQRVVLLDAAGAVVGAMDKHAAHAQPTRHLAFSVVLVDADGALLLQRRAATKYHFAGLWSNACCSHPRPGEAVTAAARRRVGEELGVGCGPLTVHGAFWYTARDPASGLAEHEYDVVLTGRVDGEPRPDPAEADAVALWDPAELDAALVADPARFTPWLPGVLEVLAAPPAPILPGLPV